MSNRYQTTDPTAVPSVTDTARIWRCAETLRELTRSVIVLVAESDPSTQSSRIDRGDYRVHPPRQRPGAEYRREHAAELDFEQRAWEYKRVALIDLIGACETLRGAIRPSALHQIGTHEIDDDTRRGRVFRTDRCTPPLIAPPFRRGRSGPTSSAAGSPQGATVKRFRVGGQVLPGAPKSPGALSARSGASIY